MASLDQVREMALANFDVLLNYWKLDYKKITEYEYDIIATWRMDSNFGGCRFNLEKARGADFAGGFLSEDDIRKSGLPFEKSDYSAFSSQGQAKIGFDIVGLAQRVHQCQTYKDAAGLLNNDLTTISKYRTLYTPASDAAQRRQKEQAQRTKKTKILALDLWESSKHHKFEGSVGEKYLNNRAIKVKDKNIRYHPSINYSITKENFHALLFKVQKEPEGPLVALHRIYLTQDGQKAKIDNPKMALAPIKGNGIWLGELSKVLALTEGPENALTLRELGYTFVCSSIFGTNLHNITIPNCVKKLIIFPDTDTPGMLAFERAKEVYSKLDIEVEGYLLPMGSLDLNDYLVKANNNG